MKKVKKLIHDAIMINILFKVYLTGELAKIVEVFGPSKVGPPSSARVTAGMLFTPWSRAPLTSTRATRIR